MNEILSTPLNGNYRTDIKLGEDMYYIRRYESLDEFYDVVSNDKDCKEYTSHEENDERYKFTGTRNYDEAIKLARYGWDKGLKGLDYYETMADKDYAFKKHDNIWDVELATTGSYVDVGAYLQGVPECMCEFVSKRTNQFADVVINISTSWKTKTETMFNRGREILKLVDALEKNHIKTRIILMEVSSKDFNDSNEGDRYVIKIIAKDYNEMLDQNRLAFALAHSSLLRRLCFCQLELEKDIRDDYGAPYGGYGTPSNIKKMDERAWKPDLDNTYTFLFDDINHYDIEVELVKQKIKEIITGEK